MKKELIVQKIDLILNNVYVEDSNNYIITGNHKRYIYADQGSEVNIEQYPEDFDFANKQVILLRKLFLNLSISDKTYFKNILLERLTKSNFVIGPTIFNTLIHIGSFDEAFNLIIDGYEDYNNKLALKQFELLIHILKNEWNIFSTLQIERIYNWFNDALDANNKIGSKYRKYPSLYEDHIKIWSKLFNQSNELLIKDLDSHLESGIDLEINLDKKELTKEFRRFSFPDDLEETLEKIDKKLTVARDDFDHKNCIDLLRSFTERLYEQIAKTININKWRSGDEKNSDKVATLFKESGLISDDQAKLLSSLRHFLSNKGSHRLKSKREDARLSRNMTIEFSLYLIRLLEIKKSGS
ncbi:MAG: hypothetical protein K9H14_05105 [Actinomycetia bacterium]|nr:hypothetical protein [Actinomycetes bacterium]